MSREDLYCELLQDLCEEEGVTITREQAEQVSKGMLRSFEFEGEMMFNITRGGKTREQELEEELKREREKIICPECHGSGEYVSHGTCFTARGSCHRCNGERRITP